VSLSTWFKHGNIINRVVCPQLTSPPTPPLFPATLGREAHALEGVGNVPSLNCTHNKKGGFNENSIIFSALWVGATKVEQVHLYKINVEIRTNTCTTIWHTLSCLVSLEVPALSRQRDIHQALGLAIHYYIAKLGNTGMRSTHSIILRIQIRKNPK
jgi:hypothetical protein